MRTTGIQVSGFNFLLRRLELALVIGDPRMAHDPLRSQRRALVVGVLLSLLIAGGAVMLGLLRPQPSLDGADLVADETGTLHLRLEDSYHPITNVASARLILQQPVEVQKTTAEQLSQVPLGQPIGIPQVPALSAAPDREWLYCDRAAGGVGTVVAVERIKAHRHALLAAPSGYWLIDATTRARITPDAARAFGTEVVPASDGLVQQFRRSPDIAMPTGKTKMPAPFDVAGRVVTAGDRVFLVDRAGVGEVKGSRRDFALASSPVPPVEVPLSDVMRQPSVDVLAGIPEFDNEQPVTWAQPQMVCAGPEGLAEPEDGAGVSAGQGTDTAQIRSVLAADEPTAFYGPRGTSALKTERGYLLVSDNGVRYSVGSQAELRALGFTSEHEVQFARVASLPDGGLLSAEKARQTTVAMMPSASTRESTTGTE
ncbi:type VII secretion protein EccB [Corynebacterium jeikeium]|uniref:type VII secretion protein EccB n=1 Tax=Corynebacterium jeikeium TaxID=38289 RepID=UPI00088BED32|nr:type VII secretion protein EccB [Corynebacterium jeikeium]SCX22630.1 Type VII secretion system protein eccB1 [Corynebacterium jeikeium]